MTVSINRHGAGYVLESSFRLPRPREEVFPFFAAAENLDRITPDRLRFRIVSPEPGPMREGLLIDYALRVHGLPVAWQTEITAWEPPVRFVDEQRIGPYRWWRHEHRFLRVGAETVVFDRVEYGVPGGHLVHGLLVRRDVRAIFEHRERVLRRIFETGLPEEPPALDAVVAPGAAF